MPLETGASSSDSKEVKNKEVYLKLKDEDIPVWVIADIIYQTTRLKPENKKSSRKIDLKKSVEKFNYEDLKGEGKIEDRIYKVLKLRDENIPFWAIADITGMPLEKIIYTSRVINSKKCGKPWLEPKTLKHLYVDKNMYFTEIADIFGCHQETVRTSIDKHDISDVDSSNRTSSKKVTKLQRADLPDAEKLIDGSVPIEDVLNEKKVEDLF